MVSCVIIMEFLPPSLASLPPPCCYDTFPSPSNTVLMLSFNTTGTISPNSNRFTRWLMRLGTKPFSLSSCLLLLVNLRHACGICLSAMILCR